MRKSWAEEMVKLCGGFNCRLLQEEINEWHEFIEQNSQWKLLQELVTQTSVLSDEVAGGRLEVAGELQSKLTEMNVIRDALYHVGKQWYETTIKPRLVEPASV